MTSDSRNNLEALLRRVEAGELDSLSPEQIDALEAYLNEAPAAAKRLANIRPGEGETPAEPVCNGEPPGSQRLGGSLALPSSVLPDVPMPTTDEWERVWNNIEAAATPRVADPQAKHFAESRAQRTAGRRILKLWPAWTAVAACVALLLTWHFATPPASAGWEMQLADQVQVDELDVYGDATAFVDFNDDGTAMIWVFEGGDAS